MKKKLYRWVPVGADWNTAVRITGGNAVLWFTSADNLSDPASAWALKFEMNVSQNWNGGTLVIQHNYSAADTKTGLRAGFDNLG